MGFYIIQRGAKGTSPPSVITPPPPPPGVLTFSGSTQASGGATSTTVNLDIGPIPSPFVVVVLNSSGFGTPTLTVGGVSMNNDINSAGHIEYFSGVATGHSGVVAITVTDSGIASNEVDFALFYNSDHTWTLNNTNTATAGNVTVSANAADAVISIARPVSGSSNYNTSTVAPTGQRFIDTAGTSVLLADWENLAAGNASFNCAVAGAFANMAAASYTPHTI